MSLHEQRRSKEVETAPTDRKQAYRLYPSLLNMNRYEVCVPLCSAGEKLHASECFQPEDRPGDTQSEVGNTDITLKAQILILEEQRKELLSINEKWAKEYRTMKQYYREKVDDFKSFLQHEHTHSEEEVCEEMEKSAALYKKVKDDGSTRTADTDASSELLKAEREVKELRVQNSILTRRWQYQHEEIRRLNHALEEALHTTQPLEASSETLYDVWKHQAEVFKEDFLTERKDREKLKQKYLELEKKFRAVCSELHVLKRQASRTLTPQAALECSCENQARCPKTQPSNPPRTQRRHALDNQQ